MSIAIIIPARLESTRLPNKLLLRETGQALICHTVEAAVRVRQTGKGVFSEIIVAADSDDIIDEVTRFSRERGLDVRAVMTDPGHQSGSDRIAEAAVTLPPDVDAVLNLQGDEPEIGPEDVLFLAELFTNSRADIGTLVYPLSTPEEHGNPNLVKVVLGEGGRALYFSRSDIPYRRARSPQSPPTYGHVGIYLYRLDALGRFVRLPQGGLEQTEKLEQLRALENGMSLIAGILPKRPPKGIDTVEDYRQFVERYWNG